MVLYVWKNEPNESNYTEHSPDNALIDLLDPCMITSTICSFELTLKPGNYTVAPCLKVLYMPSIIYLYERFSHRHREVMQRFYSVTMKLLVFPDI